MNWTRTCFCATNSMRFALLVCIVQYCVGVAGNSANDDFTCIAGNFTIGQRGNVTCHFGPDIHNIGYHFEIVRYPFDAPGSHSGHDVLRCHRLGSEVKCSVETGYEFDEKLHDNLTVFIPSVTRDVAGGYACQLIPPDNRKKQLCSLLVIESSLTTGLAEDVCYSQTGTTVAFIFGVLLIVCIIVIVYSLCRKHRTKKLKQALCCFKRARRQTTDEEIDLLLGGYSNERQQTFKMPTIKPYTDSDLEDEPEEEKQNAKFAGDDEDASARSYKIKIYPYNPADDKDQAGESEGQKKYPGDAFDEGREPFEITILPYNEDDDTDKTDQKGCPPAGGLIRYPHRDPYHRE